jgi:hypothetical protein
MSQVFYAMAAALMISSVNSYRNFLMQRHCFDRESTSIAAIEFDGTVDESNRVITGDSRLAATYGKAKLGKHFELADVLVTDPPYCLLNRRRTGGDLRDPKVRKKKIDESDTVTRFENLKEYKVFTKDWLKPCIDFGLKPNAGKLYRRIMKLCRLVSLQSNRCCLGSSSVI